MSMNKTFTKLASEFDARLQDYRDAEARVADAEAELALRRDELGDAANAMRVARDELLEAYPELVAVDRVVTAPKPGDDWRPPGEVGGITFVEVDDPDDVPDFR